MNAFAALGLEPSLVDALATRGIDAPFPVQSATLPDALAGRDVCGKAPTGSGKTLAYGLALLQQVPRADKRAPQGLVLVPTRELAKQVASVLTPYARERRRWVTAFFGGAGMPRQIDDLRRGVDVAVATPGRLTDLVERGECDLSQVRFVVIDEADRMADMGFTPQVSWILDRCATQRQTLLFSATLDGDVDALIRKYMTEPCFHEIAGPDGEEEGDAVLRRAAHLSIPVKHDNKFQELAFVTDASQRSIVFVKNRFATERTADAITDLGVSALAMHGGMTQSAREKALQRWARGEVRALVATDVAARGVHVDDVSLVVHVDPPQDEKDYIHRSGRTARAGKHGVVVSLLRKEQLRSAGAMYQRLGVEVTATTSDAVRVAVQAVEQERTAALATEAAPAGEWVDVEVSAPDPVLDAPMGGSRSGHGGGRFDDRRRPDDRRRTDRFDGPRSRDDRFAPDRRSDRPRPAWSRDDRPRDDRPRDDRPRDDRAGGERPWRDDRPRTGGFRDGGFRSGGFRDGGPRDGGFRTREERPGGFRPGGFRDGGFRDGGFRARPERDDRGGRPMTGPWRDDRPHGEGRPGATWRDERSGRPADRPGAPLRGRSDRDDRRPARGPSAGAGAARAGQGWGRTDDGRPRADRSRSDRGAGRPGFPGGRPADDRRESRRPSPVGGGAGRPSPARGAIEADSAARRERPAQVARFDERGTPLNRRARRRLQFGE